MRENAWYKQRWLLLLLVTTFAVTAIIYSFSLLWHNRRRSDTEERVRPAGITAAGKDKTTIHEIAPVSNAGNPLDTQSSMHGSTDGEVEDLALELPLPDDANAIAGYFSSEPGQQRLNDLAVLWQKRTDRYIDYLNNESFAQGVRRTYLSNELIHSLGEGGSLDTIDPSVIKYHARSRRFCKLIYEIELAKDRQDTKRIVKTLADTVDRFIADRKSKEGEVLTFMQEHPEVFSSQPQSIDESVRLQWRDLVRGITVLGFAVQDPEQVMPISLKGAAQGTFANTFLLGLTEDVDAAGPLLRIIDHDDSPFLGKMKEIQLAAGVRVEIVDHYAERLKYSNRWLVADAFDRLFMANPGHVHGYQAWRSQQGIPDRPMMEIYPYDAPQVPYELQVQVMKQITPVKTKTLLLPVPRCWSPGDGGLTEKQVEGILKFARRFDSQ